MELKPASDETAAPRQRTVAERRMRLEQALASTRIEGHQPSAEFLADMQAMVDGQIGAEEVRRRIIERARAGPDPDPRTRKTQVNLGAPA